MYTQIALTARYKNIPTSYGILFFIKKRNLLNDENINQGTP